MGYIHKLGFCSHPECAGKKETLIANVGRMLCYTHNQQRLKKATRTNFYPIGSKRKKTGEAELFLEIWNKRSHYCTNCQKFLGDEPRAQYFAHIIPKSRGEQYRLDKDNIRLLCFTCHRLMDQGTKERFAQRNPHGS